MRIRFFVWLLGILILAPVSAQVPGYMGRKFSLTGDISFFPAFRNPVTAVQDLNGSSFSFVGLYGVNLRYKLGLDYVITRKSTVGLSFQHYNTAVTVAAYSPTLGSTIVDNLGIRGYSGGIYFRTFFGKHIAPLGTYYKVELGVIGYNVSDIEDNFSHPDYFYLDENGYTAYLMNSFGRQHIFFNRLILDYGVEIGMVFPPYGDPFSRVHYVNDSYDLPGIANSRLAEHFTFNFYAGIGVLLF